MEIIGDFSNGVGLCTFLWFDLSKMTILMRDRFAHFAVMNFIIHSCLERSYYKNSIENQICLYLDELDKIMNILGINEYGLEVIFSDLEQENLIQVEKNQIRKTYTISLI